MMSRRTIRVLNTIGLLLLVMFIAFYAAHLFRGAFHWAGYVVLILAAACCALAAFGRLRLHAQVHQAAKASRASLLKHLWELRHRREW